MCCPACGTSTENDMDPVYVTTYVPSIGRVRLELPLCAPCAVEIRNRAQQGATKLEDRDPESWGRGPKTEAITAWAALGIEPR